MGQLFGNAGYEIGFVDISERLTKYFSQNYPLMKRAWSFDFSLGFAALFTKKSATKGYV
ncbi:MAG: hypothetical protein ACOCWW_03185 [Bacteroidota bacterium]